MQSANLLDINFEIKEFPFFFDPSKILSSQKRNNLGFLTVPVLGKYGPGQYNLQQPLFVMAIPCDIYNQKCYYKNQQIHLPKSVLQKLLYIDSPIATNSAPKNMSYSKEQQDQIRSSKQQSQRTFYKRDHFTLRFIISTNSVKNINSNSNVMNYICHPYIFKNSNFEWKDRHVEHIPICLVSGTKSGVHEQNDWRGISFGKLRSQYISYHIKNGFPSFSPNNMKLGIDYNTEYLNFYTVLLTKQQYSVNYHWHLSENPQFIRQILLISRCLRDLVNYYRAFKGGDGTVFDLQKILGFY